MDIKGFLSKLRDKTSFHLKDSHASETLDTDDDVEEDVMYEDYVLVTERSEEEVSIDGLPSYSAIMEPYHKESSSQEYSSVHLHTQSSNNKCPATTSDSQNNVGVYRQPTSIDDIPFVFHPSLCVQQSIHRVFQGVDLRTNFFNEEKYFHNFTQEHVCLRDLYTNREMFGL